VTVDTSCFSIFKVSDWFTSVACDGFFRSRVSDSALVTSGTTSGILDKDT
jgi:hypothetical protein